MKTEKKQPWAPLSDGAILIEMISPELKLRLRTVATYNKLKISTRREGVLLLFATTRFESARALSIFT